MSTVEMTKGIKELQQSVAQYEHRLEFAKDELAKLNKQKEALQAEIDKKTADYGIYLGARDAEMKTEGLDMTAVREKLEADKKEFLGLLQQLQRDKAAFESSKHDTEIEKSKLEARKANIDMFIIAVQKAYPLLGA